MKAKDIQIGDKFNFLEVISIDLKDYKLICKCDCGIIKEYKIGNIIYNNHTRSCGCYNKKIAKQSMKDKLTTHNMSCSKIYRKYKSMINRCYYKKMKSYYSYGGRGIEVCNEWLDDFMNFYSWAMANGYQEGLSIERNDINGNYCPENCCWIPMCEQGKNRQNSVKITAFGETKILADWEKDYRCKVSRVQLRNRIRSGMSPELAISKEKIIGRPL